MRLHNILKPKNLLNKHLKRPITKLRQSMLNQRIPQLPLILHIPTAQRTPLHPYPLKQQRRNIHSIRQLTATHQPQKHDASIPRRNVQVTLEIGRADKVDGEIDAGAVGVLGNFGGPVVGFVVEGFCDAELFFEEVDFFLGACCCVDCGGAGGFGELDAGDGD
jgi:hypothetical protein